MWGTWGGCIAGGAGWSVWKWLSYNILWIEARMSRAYFQVLIGLLNLSTTCVPKPVEWSGIGLFVCERFKNKFT